MFVTCTFSSSSPGSSDFGYDIGEDLYEEVPGLQENRQPSPAPGGPPPAVPAPRLPKAPVRYPPPSMPAPPPPGK